MSLLSPRQRAQRYAAELGHGLSVRIVDSRKGGEVLGSHNVRYRADKGMLEIVCPMCGATYLTPPVAHRFECGCDAFIFVTEAERPLVTLADPLPFGRTGF
jgi:hypothetical protein